MTRLKKVKGERNLYRDPKSELYFLRSQKAGANTFTSLNTTRKQQAIKNAEELRGNEFRKRHDIPKKASAGPSPLLGPLLDEYRKAGYPDMRQRPRDKNSSYFRDQEAYYTMLKQFFAQKYESELRPALLNEYHRWRIKPERLKKGATGDRITDLELTCFSSMLTWATNEDILPENRIKHRTRYQCGKDVRHCKELAPQDMNDLHKICKPLFSNRRSEVLGWQGTFEGMSGVRTCEAVGLRMDAKLGEVELGFWIPIKIPLSFNFFEPGHNRSIKSDTEPKTEGFTPNWRDCRTTPKNPNC